MNKKEEWIENVRLHSLMSLEKVETLYSIANIYDMSEEAAIEMVGSRGENVDTILAILDYIIFEI